MNILPKTWSIGALTLLASALPILAQTPEETAANQEQIKAAAAAGAAIGGIIGLVLGLFIIVCLWKVFTKAGQPGWAAIIPIYNIYILCKIAGKSGWWVILLCIPLVGVIMAIILCIDLARNFGKGAGFGVGLALLGIIFFPILAFGGAQYRGPAPATV